MIHAVEKVIVWPSDVGGTCPLGRDSYAETCCCSNGCCWDRCTIDTPPQICISDIPGAEWVYNEELAYYQAVFSTDGRFHIKKNLNQSCPSIG